MKVAIFGGTGKTGHHLIQQALDAGHEANALARTPSKLGMKHPNLQLFQGDLLNTTDVNSVIQESDAIISVLGPSNNKPEFTISRGMDNCCTATCGNGYDGRKRSDGCCLE